LGSQTTRNFSHRLRRFPHHSPHIPVLLRLIRPKKNSHHAHTREINHLRRFKRENVGKDGSTDRLPTAFSHFNPLSNPPFPTCVRFPGLPWSASLRPGATKQTDRPMTPILLHSSTPFRLPPLQYSIFSLHASILPTLVGHTLSTSIFYWRG